MGTCFHGGAPLLFPHHDPSLKGPVQVQRREQTGLKNVYCNDYYDYVEQTLSVCLHYWFHQPRPLSFMRMERIMMQLWWGTELERCRQKSVVLFGWAGHWICSQVALLELTSDLWICATPVEINNMSNKNVLSRIDFRYSHGLMRLSDVCSSGEAETNITLLLILFFLSHIFIIHYLIFIYYMDTEVYRWSNTISRCTYCL